MSQMSLVSQMSYISLTIKSFSPVHQKNQLGHRTTRRSTLPIDLELQTMIVGFVVIQANIKITDIFVSTTETRRIGTDDKRRAPRILMKHSRACRNADVDKSWTHVICTAWTTAQTNSAHHPMATVFRVIITWIGHT